MRGMAAIVSRGPIAKFFSWIIFIHELYPIDRELSYDFVQNLVMLLSSEKREFPSEHGQEMSNRCVLFSRKILSYKLLRYKDIKI